MKKQEHIIQKFSLELQVPAENVAYSLQRKCSELIKEKLVARLDPLFDHYFNEEDIFKIKKLDIDLGNISIDDIEKLFVDKCLFHLSEEFRRMNNQSSDEKTSIERVDPERNILDQFFYFLQTGQLPNAVMHPQFSVWAQQIVYAIENEKDYFQGHFSLLIVNQGEAIRRLLLQFDMVFIEKILLGYKPEAEKEIQEFFRMLKLSETNIEWFNVFRKVVIILIEVLARNDTYKIADRLNAVNVWLKKHVPGHTSAYPSNSVIKDLELILQPLRSSSVLNKSEQVQPEQSVIDTKENIFTENKLHSADAKDQAVFVNNAGLVLLHAFMPGLFEELGYVKENGFINGDMKSRAVHLLQFIVNGEEEMPEYFLPLNKLLCAMGDDEHIDRFIRLNDQEKEEALKLLQAVISHWTALKNTSVEGLRQGFLQRRGKLSFNKTDEYWKLQVEKSGIDILLDKLPWGFSYMQLPWMKCRLITEW